MARRDGRTAAQIAAQRTEKKGRTISMFLDFPIQLKTFNASDRKKFEDIAMDNIRRPLEGGGFAEHVGFAEVKDGMGHKLPKMHVFARFFPDKHQALLDELPKVKHVEMGLDALAKMRIAGSWLQQLGIKQCCFKKVCTMGVPMEANAKLGQPFRDAPRCNAAQLAYASRRASGFKLQRAGETAAKKQHQETQLQVNREKFERSLKRKATQECRAHEAGRCTKGAACRESHLIPDEQIKCCSTLKPGEKYFSQWYRRCRFEKQGMPCPYLHETDTGGMVDTEDLLLEE